jgi:4-amino-4-deoxy-L-arabinose transferase-like glycosyltransferase
VISICFVPLNDSTEARYGEIARKMLETGDWITLQHDYGIPFWAKPPLSTWLSAISMNFFGINEFAVRLPELLLSIGILCLIFNLAKKHSGLVVATTSVLVLAGSLYFFLDAGAVMTDPALLFCTTLSLVAFWHAFVNGSKVWSYLFFVGIGFGLLAKGPLVIVLVGLPVFFWILLRNEWSNLWKRLPWIKGSLLTSVIALPWYIAAEIKTPGFLNYFIIGEHLNRFLKPGWTGDKYGSAHNQHWGMIWIYAIAGIFPWSIVGSSWLVRYWKKIPNIIKDEDGWMSFLFLCTVLPLLFFTCASNIIYPYVLPSLPAFALLFAELANRSNIELAKKTWVLFFSLFSGVIFLVATVLFQIAPATVAKTQKTVVQEWMALHPVSDLIYWDYGAQFSAQFYSSGRVKAVKDIVSLCQLISNKSDNYLVINKHEINQIPQEIYSKFTIVKQEPFREETFLLIHIPKLTC